MARQKPAFQSGPTLSPEKAIPILENCLLEAEKLRDEPGASPKRQQWIHTGEAALISSLGGGHPSVQAFGSAQCGAYSPYDTEEYLKEQADGQLDGMVAVIKSAVEQLRWQLPDPTQIFLPAGSPHDAYVEIRKIVRTATSSIQVVDSYVDGSLWALLKNIPPGVQIRVMTMQMKGDFVLEARRFQGQHGNSIEVRQAATYHDRFILIDGARCWHLGASIKDAGNKAFLISEVLSPTIRTAVETDVNTTWTGARVVAI